MAGESSVQVLYGWPSPYCLRVELALALKGVEFQKLAEGHGTKSQLLLQSNPVYKKIPVLIHAGKPLCESGIIVQYVDETWPAASPLFPPHPYDRAIARFWADFVDNKVFYTLFSILRSKGDEQKAAIENSLGVMATLEEGLGSVRKEGPFFGGASVGYVDIMLGPLLPWLFVLEEIGNFKFPFEKYPLLQVWSLAFKELPIASILPEGPEVLKFALEILLKRPSN